MLDNFFLQIQKWKKTLHRQIRVSLKHITILPMVLLGTNAEEIAVQVIIFDEWSEHVDDRETCNCAPQLAEGGSSNERWKTKVDVH